MSEPCEFVFVPRKLNVQESLRQIENGTSQSEASILIRTALDAGEMETLMTDQLEAA